MSSSNDQVGDDLSPPVSEVKDDLNDELLTYESYESGDVLGSHGSAPHMRFDSKDMAVQTLESKYGKRSQLANEIPILKGNMLFAALSTFATFPLSVAAQRSQARQVNLSCDSKNNDDDEPIKQSVIYILRNKGLHSLYRGFPLYLLHQILTSKIKDWTSGIIKEIRSLRKKPKNGAMKVNNFHRHLAYYLNFRKDISFQKTMSIDTLDAEDSDDDYDSVLVTEAIDLFSDIVSQTCTYPLLTIALRQMANNDDTGYSIVSMFNVSRTLDEGFSWCYQGIEYSILKSILRSSNRIFMDYLWDTPAGEEMSVNTMVMKEASKGLTGIFLSPLEILSDLHKLKSNAPGLIDENAQLFDMIDVCMPTSFRWTVGLTCLAIPVIALIERISTRHSLSSPAFSCNLGRDIESTIFKNS